MLLENDFWLVTRPDARQITVVGLGGTKKPSQADGFSAQPNFNQLRAPTHHGSVQIGLQIDITGSENIFACDYLQVG